MNSRSIRPLAIALIKNSKGQFLLHEARDTVKNETFYRPLGGGIEFGEKGQETLAREFREEINQELKSIRYIHTFENIFTYEGQPGHQIILLYSAEFVSGIKESYPIIEGGKAIGAAVWRSLEEILEKNEKLYPVGVEAFFSNYK